MLHQAVVKSGVTFLLASLCLALILLLIFGASSSVFIPLGLTAFLLVILNNRLFQFLAGRRWGLFPSLLAGIVTGGGVLYLLSLLLWVVMNLGSPYFDVANSSHWAELFTWPLFVVGSLPIFVALILVVGALGGGTTWFRLRSSE